MPGIRAPRSLKQATELLEQFAGLQGDIDEIEANRAACIADVNARCDTAANELLKRREAIREKLQPWWAANAAELTQGKRKSIELGGCIIGTRSGKESLGVAGDEKAIAKTLLKRAWAKGLVRVTVSLDKAAILKAIGGAHKRQLAKLGLGRKPGEEACVLERAGQQGTLSGAGA